MSYNSPWKNFFCTYLLLFPFFGPLRPRVTIRSYILSQLCVIHLVFHTSTSINPGGKLSFASFFFLPMFSEEASFPSSLHGCGCIYPLSEFAAFVDTVGGSVLA